MKRICIIKLQVRWVVLSHWSLLLNDRFQKSCAVLFVQKELIVGMQFLTESSSGGCPINQVYPNNFSLYVQKLTTFGPVLNYSFYVKLQRRIVSFKKNINQIKLFEIRASSEIIICLFYFLMKSSKFMTGYRDWICGGWTTKVQLLTSIFYRIMTMTRNNLTTSERPHTV